jgi:hypothetical protein
VSFVELCDQHIVTWGNQTSTLDRLFSTASAPRPLLCNDSVNTFQQKMLCFLRGPCKGVILKTNDAIIHTRVEAGSNTSTVTLRVVGGDKKGSLKSETVKYGHESEGTRTPERQGPASYTKDRPERSPQKNKTVSVKE